MTENNNELYDLYATILDRKQNQQEGSYTCYLFEPSLPPKTATTPKQSLRSPTSSIISLS